MESFDGNMGLCLSASKVRSSNSNNSANASATKKTRRKWSSKNSNTKQQNKPQEGDKNRPDQQQAKPVPPKVRNRCNGRRGTGGVIPCGKRTDFGYAKDFDARYTIGKLLGHGQFGYTYVATDKSNGDRVAVKRIEKSKVWFDSFFRPLLLIGYCNFSFGLILSRFSELLWPQFDDKLGQSQNFPVY